MDEFARIKEFFVPLAGEAGLGLQDDAAVLTPPSGRQLVLTVDQMLEGVHFLPGDDPALTARKLLRRNLSDLAAMGATPFGYLITTALPSALPDTWLARFTAGLETDQRQFGISLLGGDSSSSRADIMLTACLLGHVAPGQALRRNGARVGDELWVTGTIGDAVLGLEARLGRLPDPDGFLARRSLLPDPRVGLNLEGIATAAIDISDGLLQDLGHICRASGLAAIVQAELVPLSAQAAALGPEVLERRLTGGDDYELLLAVPPEKSDALQSACAGIRVTKIGGFQPGEGVELRDENGSPLNIASAGWKHF